MVAVGVLRGVSGWCGGSVAGRRWQGLAWRVGAAWRRWWWAYWGGTAGRWWRRLARRIGVAWQVGGDGSGVLRDITGRRGVKLGVAGSWTPGWGGVVAGWRSGHGVPRRG
ncbi:hypothetical protein H4582DRAFT_2130204 [Lactarius indigo]|nr:hypothetical protein H4582DRAFT_2130204 [Lactarius indigo]